MSNPHFSKLSVLLLLTEAMAVTLPFLWAILATPDPDYGRYPRVIAALFCSSIIGIVFHAAFVLFRHKWHSLWISVAAFTGVLFIGLTGFAVFAFGLFLAPIPILLLVLSAYALDDPQRAA